jgi:FAD/FMN-containing dehydrogenase
VRFRDRITEAIAAAATAAGVPTYKLDVAVPMRSVAELIDVAHRAADDDGARLIAFGHLAEGNLHLNYLEAQSPRDIANTVLEAVARLRGTISAEHGIGVAKTPWLHLIRTAADLDAQRAIRRALDPNRILNPGVLDPTPQVLRGQVPRGQVP